MHTKMQHNEKKVKELIEESIRELERVYKLCKEIYIDIPPVLWFGDIEEEPVRDRILVVSANPSHINEPKDNPRIPCAKEWSIEKADVNQLYKGYNNYFSHGNPDVKWFGANPATWNRDSQGHIEGFLSGMNASFYSNKATYQAIHIDLLPFSTTMPFTTIAKQLFSVDGLSAWVDKHVQEMISLIHPKYVIVNGVSNFQYFNQCVNVGAQPYQSFIYERSTIWIGRTHRRNTPIVIGISENMGSSCRKKRSELQNLGKEVKERLGKS